MEERRENFIGYSHAFYTVRKEVEVLTVEKTLQVGYAQDGLSMFPERSSMK